MSRYRCRKCRYTLVTGEKTMDCGCPQSLEYQHSLVFIDSEDMSDWLESAVNETSWTRGKLLCPQCQSRVGSFNFTIPLKCDCKSLLPSVHLLRGKVDLVGMHPVLDRSIQPSDLSIACTEAPKMGNNMGLSYGEAVDVHLMDPAMDSADNSAVNSTNQDQELESLDSSMDSETSNSSRDSSPDSETSNSSRDSSPDSETSNSEETASSESESSEDSLDGGQSEAEENAEVVDQNEEPGNESAIRSTDQDRHETDNANELVLENRWGILQEETRMSDSNESQTDKRESSDTDENLYEDFPVKSSWQEQSKYICPVCLDIYYRPQKCTPCDHVFCDSCIRMVAQDDPSKTYCPLCRELITRCHFDKVMEESVRYIFKDEYKVRKKMDDGKKLKRFPLPRSELDPSILEQITQRDGRDRVFRLELTPKVIIQTAVVVSIASCLFAIVGFILV